MKSRLRENLNSDFARIFGVERVFDSTLEGIVDYEPLFNCGMRSLGANLKLFQRSDAIIFDDEAGYPN